MSYGRNRQSLLSGPRSCPSFGVQTAARLPPHPDAPGPLVPWDQTENRIGGSDHQLPPKPAKPTKRPPILPIFPRSNRCAANPHPDEPGPLVPWDETETESEAPILSYDPFFAAPEAMRYSPPVAPAAYRTRSKPTERTRRVPTPPHGPPRGMNRPSGGRNRQNGPNSPDLTHFSAFKPPCGYPPIPMPPER